MVGTGSLIKKIFLDAYWPDDISHRTKKLLALGYVAATLILGAVELGIRAEYRSDLAKYNSGQISEKPRSSFYHIQRIFDFSS